MNWKPIEDVLKEGTPIDLWIIPPRKWPNGFEWKQKYVKACRYTDCVYDTLNDSWIRQGKWVTGRTFYKDGDQYFDPTDKSEEAFIATHWMLPPGPPEP